MIVNSNVVHQWKYWLIPIMAFLLVSCGGGGGGGNSNNNATSTTPTPHTNIIFVTSTLQNGNLGGLAGADAICNTRAVAAGLQGNFVAWLSTSTVDAIDRLGSAPGWLRTDGLPFSSSAADLAAGKIYYPPNRDELGNPVGSTIVQTGTDGDGQVGAGFTCNDWTNGSTGSVRGGDPTATSNIWSFFASGGCVADRRFYCLSIDGTVPITPPANSGRIAFVSDNNLDGDFGLAGADMECNNNAALASLPGNYRALLATDSASAASRFDLSGQPWVRLDGVAIVEQASDLGDPEQLIAPINLQADGTTYLGNRGVWTGAPSFFQVSSGNTCTNWNSTLGNANITRAGKSVASVSDTSSCSFAISRLFCLQE